ncbi:lysoplasmalogenase [Agriterribacter humi]|jgi:uncharacterized membrane protein YhhN|uniref:lysoplasmalogenase n=1 Tax=Agriterribacter humi TaxID=1104781 RepID=UPI0012649E66|nr:lysoplasmalogenase [Agriterribacter humi]
MKRISFALGCIYGLAAIADIFFVFNTYEQERLISKPLLMIVLMLMYAAETGVRSTFSKIFLCALLFSWSGDLLLMFNGFFIGGLSAFLAAHVCYIIYTLRINPGAKGVLQFQPLFGIPILAWGILLSGLLLPFLDTLKIPVIIYATVICIFWTLTLNLFGKTDKKTAALFFCGAGQFVLSDSVLAVNQFIYPFKILPPLIMLTYCSAQLLLVLASIRHLRKINSI